MSIRPVFVILILSLIGICHGVPVPQYQQPRTDGARCPNVSCSPPIPGGKCDARYERDDGCCPVWYCQHNGASSMIYGKSTGTHTSASFSTSSSSGNMGGMPPLPIIQLPNLVSLLG